MEEETLKSINRPLQIVQYRMEEEEMLAIGGRTNRKVKLILQLTSTKSNLGAIQVGGPRKEEEKEVEMKKSPLDSRMMKIGDRKVLFK